MALWRYFPMTVSFFLIGATKATVGDIPPVYDLRVEHIRTPAIGITEAIPRFSWRLKECGRAVRQVAYQIAVTDLDRVSLMWDSGRVASNDTNGIEYSGKNLTSDTQYKLTITWWSNTGITSQPASGVFETGPFSSDWEDAEWIAGDNQRQLQWEYIVPSGSAVTRASLSVDAPGCAIVVSNGISVNGNVGMCQWTSFSNTYIFNVYNITSTIQEGPNAIGFLLGHVMYGVPTLRSRLVIVLANGQRLTYISVGTKLPPSPAPPQPPAPPSPPRLCGTVAEHGNLELACPNSQNISNVTFASFGTPTGACPSFTVNPSCNFAGSMSAVEAICVGRQRCVLEPHCGAPGMCSLYPVGPRDIPDPCHMTAKHLSVKVTCGTSFDATTSMWYAAVGPIISDDPWKGTTTNWSIFFADKAAGWGTVQFDRTQSPQIWTGAHTSSTSPANTIVHRTSSVPPTREVEVLTPVRATTQIDGSCLITFPENFVGAVVVRASSIRVSSPGNISLRHSEVLSTNGTAINMSWTWGNMDVHVLSNVPKDDMRPAFTWHGFQYVSLTTTGGVGVDCAVTSFLGSKVHATVEKTGLLSFDDTDDGVFLSSLQNMILRGQLSNVAEGMPTDCPTREKHGWLGDAVTTAEEAMMNFDFEAVYEEFLNTIRDSQNSQGDVPGVVPAKHHSLRDSRGEATDISWSAAYPIITGWLVKHYNNVRVAQRHWPSLVKFMENLLTTANTNCPDGLPNFFTWGDWCAVASRALATPGTGRELASFSFIASLDQMAMMADKLGESSAKIRYSGLATQFRSDFHKLYYNNSTMTYGTNPLLVQSLTTAPLALGNVVPPDLEGSVVQGLVKNIQDYNWSQTVGSVGAKLLLTQLAQTGNADIAMRIATQTAYPSFGYWLSLGATTCWENYSGQPDPSHPPTPTHNHIFLCGGLGEWLYRTVGGIFPVQDGYRQASVFPDIVEGRGPAKANTSVVTPRGTITVSWTRLGGGSVQVSLTVPAAVELVKVTFRAPAGADGKPLPTMLLKEGATTVWTGSGGFVKDSSIGVNLVSWNSVQNGLLVAEVVQGSFSFTFTT